MAAKKLLNGSRTEEQETKRAKRQIGQLSKLKSKLSSFGIDLNLPTVTTKSDKKSLPRTPVMEVDESDVDITLKTPPNVRKIKSRSNSAAATPKGSKTSTPVSSTNAVEKANMIKLEKVLMSSSKLKKKSTPTSLKKAKK